MKCTIKQIDDLVERIQAGDPPKLKKSEEPYYDPAMSGFGIRLLRSGRASWFLEYRRGKGLKKKTLGDVRVKNREAAIEEARALLGKIDYHKWDPEAARRERMRMDKVTFKSVMPDFLAWKKKPRVVKGRLRKNRPRTLRNYERYLTKHFQPFHNLKLDEITRKQISEQLARIEEDAARAANARGGNETAYQCRSLIRDFFNWAIGDGCKLPEDHPNPTGNLTKVPKNRPRDRVLSNDEIRRIWKTCEDWEAEILAFAQKGIKRAPGGFTLLTDYPRAVQLLFLTGCRDQEIGDLHWSEVDLDKGFLRIVEHRTKNGRVLCNPLPDMAIELFRKIQAEAKATRPNDPVFGRGDAKKHPSKKPPRPAFKVLDNGVEWKLGVDMGDTANKIKKRFRRGDIGFWKQLIDPAVEQKVRYLLAARIPVRQIMDNEHLGFNTIKAIEAKMKAGPVPEAPAPSMPHWTLHDIRRTYRTNLSECGVDINIGEALVGHRHRPEGVSQSNIETYNVYEYWRQKKKAVAEWEKRFRKILDGTAPEIETPDFGPPDFGPPDFSPGLRLVATGD